MIKIVVRPRLELLEHLVDQLLAFQVDLAGRLVENQDRRVAEDGPGQCDPLPLPAGDAAPELPDAGVVAVCQVGLDEAVGMGLFGGVDHVLCASHPARRSGYC